MKRKTALITAVLITLVLAGGLWSLNKSQVSTEKDLSVRLKWLDQAQFAGFYTAKQNGFYTDNNLSVRTYAGGPDISPVQLVLSGSNDFGVIGADQLVLAREKGAPVVALGVIYQKTPVAIASLSESNIHEPKDLEGKTVAIVYGKDEEVIYKALLKSQGVDRSKIREVPLTFDLNQLISKKVDAIIVYENNEPTLLEQRGHKVNLIKPRDYGVNYYADTLFTTEKMIQENPEAVRGFVQATMKGWQAALTDKEAAVDNVLAVNGSLNRAHQIRLLELSERLVAIDGRRIGETDAADWENLQNTLLEQGVQKQKIDIGKLFTNDYL